MIIAGFYGIGKTTYCEVSDRKVLDLDAKLFTIENDMVSGLELLDFYSKHVLTFALQGFNVFIPSTEHIINHIKDIKKDYDSLSTKIVGVLPNPDDIALEHFFIDHITNIFLNNINKYNYSSLINVREYYHETISHMAKAIGEKNKIHYFSFKDEYNDNVSLLFKDIWKLFDEIIV